MSIHDGHRKRKKEQFLRHGLDAFADHEALELLLYYAIPRSDTNPVAHRLMERFGSLEGVFSASPEELEKVEGVGKNAATLLSLLMPLWRRMKSGSGSGDTILNSAERSGTYFIDRFLGVKQEELHEACLDAKGKLLACCRVAEGSVDSVSVNVRRIVENALRFGASNVILSHNHPSGVALPSGEDERMTLAVWDALHAVGIELVDHIIVADGDFVSLRQNGLLPPH